MKNYVLHDSTCYSSETGQLDSDVQDTDIGGGVVGEKQAMNTTELRMEIPSVGGGGGMLDGVMIGEGSTELLQSPFILFFDLNGGHMTFA